VSLWENGWASYPALSSFTQPVADPGIDPGVGPLICVHFNRDWLPVVLGALLQLCQPPSWDVDDPDDLNTVLGRATALLNAFSEAELCPVMESGTLSGTILSRTPYLDIPVTFVQTYSGAPVVIASSLTDKMDVTIGDLTATGCTFRLSFDTEVVSDTAVAANWIAHQT
jgi:hypothetical protein